MSEMTAGKAREILIPSNHVHVDGLCNVCSEAQGYLRCLEEGPEVKALVDEMRTILHSDTCLPKDVALKALSAFQKAVKP